MKPRTPTPRRPPRNARSPLPARLRERRTLLGLSQGGLSRVTGIAQKSISFWECGRATPDARNLGKLADALGVTVDYLLGRKTT